MKQVIIIGTLIGMSVIVSGCASLTRGTSEEVKIYAAPEGVQIGTDIGQICHASPCSLKVPRKTEFTVIASKAGYHSQEVRVRTEVAGSGVAAMTGNVLAGGLIGAGVDAYTGAMMNHKPNPVFIELVPIDAKNPETPKGDLSEIKQQYIAKKKDLEDKAVKRAVGG